MGLSLKRRSNPPRRQDSKGSSSSAAPDAPSDASSPSLGRRSFLMRRKKSSMNSETENTSGASSRPMSRVRLPRPTRKFDRSQSMVDDTKQLEEIANNSDSPPSNTDNPKKLKRGFSLDLFRRKPLHIALQRDQNRSKESKSSSRASTTEESDFEDRASVLPSIADRTKVVPESVSPPKTREDLVVSTTMDDMDEGMSGFNCATAILGHTYFERMCGNGDEVALDGIHAERAQLPEDPTVQESIECIFASQLEEGLELWDDPDETDHLEARQPTSEVVSPAELQQSRLNRSDRQCSSISQSKKRYEQASLVYVGTFDPTIPDDEKTIDENEGPLPCPCAHSRLPALDPSEWPQAPLLLRPTPGSGMKVKGVRFAASKDYLWEPGSHLSWSERLAEHWGVPGHHAPRVGCCEKCAFLPINNGNEKEGESLVTDFETDLFDGSMLVRIRFSHGSTPEPYDDTKGYFKGVNRRFHVVMRGRFKKAIPFTELRTGFEFERPCGKLPPRWLLRGGIKVLSFFAPQLDAKLEGDKPHSLTPLGSTPQAICVDSEYCENMEVNHHEPMEPERVLLSEAASNAEAPLQRARARKKAFDKLYVQKSEYPKADTSKVYTFEFLQHLFNFQEFSVELGSMLGSLELEGLLGGQPLQIMATHGDQRLWSFDVWHECLWETAKQHEAQERQQ